MPEEVNELLVFLVKEGSLTQEQAVQAQEKSLAAGKSVEEIITKDKLLPEEQIAQAKGRLWRFPYVDLAEQDIDKNVLNLIPKNVAANYQMVAFKKEGDELQVALFDPKNFQAQQAADFLANEEKLKVKYFIASSSGLKAAFQKYELLRREVAEVLEAAKDKLTEKEKPRKEEVLPVEEIIKGAPVSRIVAVVTRHAVDGRASDIHIEPFAKECRIRYRIDGVLHTSLVLPGNLHSAIVARIKVLSNMRLDETRVPQDGRITEEIEGKTIDFRVSTLPLREGQEKVVMRILDTSVGAPTLEQLGFNNEHVKVIQKNIKQPHGLLLISGPTGSGKSTTLSTVLNMLNGEGLNIVTLEDPIEYYVKGVNQSQIRPEVGFTFASGLRSLLRQDPNVIMVGEIRDGETAELAVHAALTGHLILTTIHTNDSLGVVPRLFDMKVEPFLLAATMNVAIAQRLARKICSDCKIQTEIPANLEQEMRELLKQIPVRYLPENLRGAGAIPKLIFYKGQGCPHCGGSGYKGRVAVAEVLQATPALSAIIAEGFKMEEAKKEIKNQDMITLKQDALLKVLQGLTTVEEMLRISQE
ncbi:MAG: GspE/PulE family protein [bacterium]|nr:GspE/PulE family protein [bacterium]